MIKKSYFILTKAKEFWNVFRTMIVDFTIIGALGFIIYWTRWRK